MMTEKRYTTVELPKPNNWGIWYDGNYLSTYEACYLLNEQQDEIGQLEKSIEQLRTIIDVNIDFNSLFSNKELSDICNETGWELSEKNIKLQQLEKENEQLKSELCEKDIRLDFLKAENIHMSDLVNENEQLKKRNNNQYNQLNQLWQLIEAKNWETLTGMVEQMKKDEERLQQEWKCYE